MLAKLMKYEFRSTARTFLPIYGALLATAIVTRFLMWGDSQAILPNSFAYNLVSMLVAFLFVALLVAVFAMVLIITLQRYYKNLLGEEGYLSMTLPVKPWQYITSKLVVSCVWFLVSGVVAMLSFFILMLNRSILTDFFYFFQRMFDMIRWNRDVVLALVELAVLGLVSMVCSTLLLYASMSMGQLSHRSRKLASFGWFLVFWLAIQLVVGFATRGYLNLFSPTGFTAGHSLMWFYILLMAALSALFFALSNYMLSHKLNLE